jgi:hypothetical protein
MMNGAVATAVPSKVQSGAAFRPPTAAPIIAPRAAPDPQTAGKVPAGEGNSDPIWRTLQIAVGTKAPIMAPRNTGPVPETASDSRDCTFVTSDGENGRGAHPAIDACAIKGPGRQKTNRTPASVFMTCLKAWRLMLEDCFHGGLCPWTLASSSVDAGPSLRAPVSVADGEAGLADGEAGLRSAVTELLVRRPFAKE